MAYVEISHTIMKIGLTGNKSKDTSVKKIVEHWKKALWVMFSYDKHTVIWSSVICVFIPTRKNKDWKRNA